MRARMLLAGAAVAAALGCADRKADCRNCDTVVIAATVEPPSLLPPMVYETVGRDISDLVFERLAVLSSPGAPIDSTAYRPGLAVRWERVDSLSWRFHLRPGARWHDGRPVTAEDVVFSFEAYADSAVNAVARSQVAGRMTADRGEFLDRAACGFASPARNSSTMRPSTSGSCPSTSGTPFPARAGSRIPRSRGSSAAVPIAPCRGAWVSI